MRSSAPITRPARTGRSFGVYHASVGVAALLGGIVFGGLYQGVSGSAALIASGSASGVLALALLLRSPD